MATYSTIRSNQTPSTTSRGATRLGNPPRFEGPLRSGDSEFSSQYPMSSRSQTRADRTGGTWPSSQAGSIFSVPPPRYESPHESETEENDHTSNTANERDGPHIVLAIDYGTTFSGLAWMQTDGETPNNLDDVQLFEDWPRKVNPKVPSTYSYDTVRRGRPKRQQWGYDIDDTSNVIRWTKSRLKLQSPRDELNVLRELVEALGRVDGKKRDELRIYQRKTPLYLSKRPADVVRDYLSRLAMCWHKVMTERGTYTLDHVPLHIVITHPTNWEYEAMNATYQAVIAAFPSTHFKRVTSISFSPEPESCALYTINELLFRRSASFTVGESFIICDAGGGTIDLGSYRIDQINPLKLTKIGVLTGDDFGATLIDRAFLDWINPKVPSLDLSPGAFLKNGMFVMDGISNAILEAFQDVKHLFTGSADEREYRITLPRFEAFDTGIGDDEEDGSGVMDIPPNDLKTMFDKSVQRVVELIGNQYITTMSYDGEPGIRNRVTNVFMAGGFSESQYLLDQVREWANTYPDVQVHRANDCWSSVVKGAVLRGMGLGMVPGHPLQTSPVNVGVCLVQPHQSYKHGADVQSSSSKDLFYGGTIVPDQISWLVQKGDVIPPDKPIEAAKVIRIDYNVYEYEEGRTLPLKWVITRRDRTPTTISETTGCRVETIDIPLQDLHGKASKTSKRLLNREAHRSVDARAVVVVSEHGAAIRVENQGRSVVQSSIDITSVE